MRTAFEREGDLRGVDLLAALVTLWRTAESGSLRAWRPAGSCGFDIASGEIVGVTTSDPRFDTSAILVRAGKLDAGALERLAVPEGADRSLAALQAGIITRREWRWGEKIRAIEVLADLLTWIEGEYAFDPVASQQTGEFRLAIPRLVLELFLRSRDRNLIEHQLGPADVPLVRAENFDREFSTFGLTADAESVVALIDGRATAAQISQQAPAEDFAVQKLLAALVTLGLVRPEYAPEEPARTVAIPTAESPEPPEDPFAHRAERFEEAAAAEAPLEEPPWEHASPAEEDRAPELEPQSERAWDSGVPQTAEPSGAEWPGTAEPVERLEESDWAGSPVTRSEREGRDWGGPTDLAEPTEPMDQTLERPVEIPPEGPRGSSRALLGWLVAFLLIAGAVVFVLRARLGPSGPAATEVSPAVTVRQPIEQPTAPAAVVSPATVESTPSPAATAAWAPATAARSRPTAVATAVARPPAPPAAARAVWDERARQDQRRLAGDARTRFAIQLELACEVPTLVEAWKRDRPEGTMWLLPAKHGGRDCFRVLWGRYPTLEAARAAKPRIPSFFVSGTNRPAVVGVR